MHSEDFAKIDVEAMVNAMSTEERRKHVVRLGRRFFHMGICVGLPIGAAFGILLMRFA